MTKVEMAEMGRDLVVRFCKANGVPVPEFSSKIPKSVGDACGLYDWRRGRNGTIYVDPSRCACCGYGGPAWSWPGHSIDRTPCGVHAHEMGHHVDCHRGFVASRIRRQSGEPPLTSYCPNDPEWFAEMMRLFATNADLLEHIRPKTYRALRVLGLKPVEHRTWRQVLQGAPARTVEICERRIREASL